jgi:hypothetical protein
MFDAKSLKSNPPCPLCSSLTRLKELWELEENFHKFFKCIECDVEFPVVLKRDDAGVKNNGPR